MFNSLRHLLPGGLAFQITVDKVMRKFFAGLGAFAADVITFIDDVWGDVWPASTRNLTEWESQFGLTAGALTDAQRRTRLAGAWQARGGQSPAYIQDTLRNAGFDVYVHEAYNTANLPYVVCGDADAECGNSLAECSPGSSLLRDPRTVLAPNNYTPVVGMGYVVSNKIPGLVLTYTSSDPDEWPYYLYVGGQTFGSLAQVPADRREEFEALCLKLRPAHTWLGLLIEYV